MRRIIFVVLFSVSLIIYPSFAWAEQKCFDNDPWFSYCSISAETKLLSKCEAEQQKSTIAYEGECREDDKLKITGVKVQEDENDGGTRDFSYSVNTTKDVIVTLRVFKETRNIGIATKTSPPEQLFVSDLSPLTKYLYEIKIVEKETNRTAIYTGEFTTDDFLPFADRKKLKDEVTLSLKEVSALKKLLKTHAKALQFFVIDVRGLTLKIDVHATSLESINSFIEKNNFDNAIEAYNDLESHDLKVLRNSIMLIQKDYSILKNVRDKNVKKELIDVMSLIASSINDTEYDDAYESLLIFTKEIEKNKNIYLAKNINKKNQNKLLDALKKLEDSLRQE